jgi:hypothetical protein
MKSGKESASTLENLHSAPVPLIPPAENDEESSMFFNHPK